MRRNKWTGLATLIVIVVAMAALLWRNSYSDSGVQVKVTPATRGEISAFVSVSGNVINRDEVVISSIVPGVIIGIGATEGERVKKGQVIAYLDGRENEIHVRKSEMALRSAEKKYAIAIGELGYLKTIFAVGGESQKSVDRASVHVQVAQSDVLLAQDDFRLAQIQSDNFKIKSPVNGTITACSAKTGASVKPGEPLFKLAPKGVQVIEIQMDAFDIDAASIGKVVTASTDVYPGKEWHEKIAWIAPSVAKEGASSYIVVRIGLNGNSPPLILGQQVEVKIPRLSLNDVVVVPSEAIMFKQGKPFVAILSEGRIRITPIEIGAADLKHTEIVSGLSIGQQVILPEGKNLTEGDLAHVIPELALN